MRKQPSGRSRLGQSMVEFALVAPLFFVLVFGIIEGGRLIWTNHTLSNAAKEGARYASVRGSGSIQPDAPVTAGAIENHVMDISTGLSPEELHITLTLLDGDMGDRSRFRVDASFEYDFVVTSLFGVDGITLEASSTDMFWRESSD